MVALGKATCYALVRCNVAEWMKKCILSRLEDSLMLIGTSSEEVLKWVFLASQFATYRGTQQSSSHPEAKQLHIVSEGVLGTKSK